MLNDHVMFLYLLLSSDFEEGREGILFITGLVNSQPSVLGCKISECRTEVIVTKKSLGPPLLLSL